MASAIWSPALDKLFDQAYADAVTFGRGMFGISMLSEVLAAKHAPYGCVFRWKEGPMPGYSHAHSRKIRREARQRAPVTIRLSQAWNMTDLEILKQPSTRSRP